LQYRNFKSFIEAMEDMVSEMLGETQFADVRSTSRLANNGVVKEELQIFTPGKQSGRALDMNPLYERYLSGTDIEQLAGEIVQLYMKDEPAAMTKIWKDIKDYGRIRKSLFIRVINYEDNRMLLSLCPHIRVLDLALVFRIIISDTEEGLLSMAVDHQIFKQWHVSIETLRGDAMANTEERFPVKVLPTHELAEQGFEECKKKGFSYPPEVQNMIGQWYEFRKKLAEEGCLKETMYAITNAKKINGATAVFYPETLKRFASDIGGDIYLLPSSIHEMMAVPCADWDDPEDLKAIVTDANKTTVTEEERLGNHVYKYVIEEDRIIIAA